MSYAHIPVPGCFEDFHWDGIEEGRFTTADYIKRLTAHFGGARHEHDEEGICPKVLYDHFGSAVRQAAVEKQYRPIRGKPSRKNHRRVWH